MHQKVLTQHNYKVSAQDRHRLAGHCSPVVWLTGLPASGKSTIANQLDIFLYQNDFRSYVLDGDNIRLGLNRDLGFTDSDRTENIRRISEVAKLFSDAGVITITAFISPFAQDRRRARDIIGDENFVEVFVDAPLEVCEQRDPKGLYKKARKGELKMFTGIDSVYETPEKPDLVIYTAQQTVEQSVGIIGNYIQQKFLCDRLRLKE